MVFSIRFDFPFTEALLRERKYNNKSGGPPPPLAEQREGFGTRGGTLGQPLPALAPDLSTRGACDGVPARAPGLRMCEGMPARGA